MTDRHGDNRSRAEELLKAIDELLEFARAHDVTYWEEEYDGAKVRLSDLHYLDDAKTDELRRLDVRVWMLSTKLDDLPLPTKRQDKGWLGPIYFGLTGVPMRREPDYESWAISLDRVWPESMLSLREAVRALANTAPDVPRAEAPGVTQGYLGLEFDEGHYVVRRAGYAAEVDLSRSKLRWGLLLAFAEARGSLLSDKRLMDVWEKHGQAKKPAKGTVADTISDLNEKIACLGLHIDCARGMGRKLVSQEPVSDTPSV
jgi:hypothetical protein